MFNFLKKFGKSASESNIEHLTFYLNVVNGTDALPINQGDIVYLKTEPPLDKNYAGFLPMNDGNKPETVFAYVLSVKELSTYTRLGSGLNALLAVYQGGSIKLSAVDSRLFKTITDDLLVKVPEKLKEFITDAPNTNPQVGQLVRPRMHHDITREIFSFAEEKFLQPLIVLNVNGDKVILGGTLASTGDKVHEVETYSNLICDI